MNIVYQNIEESEYKIEVDNITFYFSSSFNLGRFKERYSDFIFLEERKIENRYHVNINMKKYLLLSFYKIIEKRGFLISYKNKKYRDDINLITSLEE